MTAMTTTSKLFEPMTIRDITFRNRIWVAPMCQYSCFNEDGIPNDWHLVNAGTYAAGGAGLVLVEATGVSPEARITAECAGIWNDSQRDSWARVVDFAHSQGSKIGIQLAHSGRKGSDYKLFVPQCGSTKPLEEGGWKTVAPSAIACPGMDAPQELDQAGIDKIVHDFAQAAIRSVDAGFDVVMIHAAHGYLLHEFLSPLSNARTDEFGGSLHNRARILLEVVRAIRAVIPESMPLFMRFSGTDWVDGGFTIEETAQVAAWCSEVGVDFFDISSGGLLKDIFISVKPGYQVPLTEHVRSVARVAASAVGLITTAEQAEEIIASGKADAIMLARELIRDPHFPLRAAHELGVEIDYWPPQFRAGMWRDA